MQSSATEPAVLDRSYLQDNYHDAGFGYLLPEILELCRQQAFSSLAALETYLAAGDFQNLAGEAHLLKGAAGTTGASLLAEKARTLERAAESADPPSLMVIFEELKMAVSLTNDAIDAELGRLAAAEDLDVF